MDRAQTFLRFGVDKLQPDHFAVVDQCVANLQSQTVDRKDDRLKNASGVVVERTVDEDPRRPPLHSQAATFIRFAKALISKSDSRRTECGADLVDSLESWLTRKHLPMAIRSYCVIVLILKVHSTSGNGKQCHRHAQGLRHRHAIAVPTPHARQL